MNYEDRITKSYLEDALAGCGNCTIATGSYTGTGTFGSSHPTQLTFPFQPKLVCIYSGVDAIFLLYGAPYASGIHYFNSTTINNLTWGENSVRWYNDSGSSYQFNNENKVYNYIIIS